MNVKKYFNYSPDLELTVAQIGINKWDWEATTRFDEGYARKVMELNRFDILPIQNDDKIEHYYQTEKWGDYSKVHFRSITRDDQIYYRLSFIDLIRRMIHEDKYHYFLSDSSGVLGLVSLNNLNCLAVYNYIYQITASLERIVSDYLKRVLDENHVLEILRNTNDKQANSIAVTFDKQKTKNNENSIFQYLFFPTIGTLLSHSKEIIEGDCPELLEYRTKFSAGNLYWDIRNTVSHPIKPLFLNAESVIGVNEMITDYVEIRALLS